MNNYIEAALLGIIQGLSEFLPISSSGHLTLFEYLIDFKIADLLAFDIAVHFGTILAIIILFKESFINLVLFKDLKLFFWLIISMIPAGIVGVGWGSEIVYYFKDPVKVSLAMIFMALVYFLIYFFKTNRKSGTWHSAILMGIGQAIAILPGISRSGLTMSFAKAYGISLHEAAKYSFIMAVPIILGAQILSLTEISNNGAFNKQWDLMLIGMVTSFIVSYFSAKFMLNWCKKHGLRIFGIYLIILGLTVFFLQIY